MEDIERLRVNHYDTRFCKINSPFCEICHGSLRRIVFYVPYWEEDGTQTRSINVPRDILLKTRL